MTKTAITTVVSKDCSDDTQSPPRSSRALCHDVMKDLARLFSHRHIRGGLQVFEELAGSFLFGPFLGGPFGTAYEFGVMRSAWAQQAGFHCECLAMFRARLFNKHVRGL